MNKIIPHTEIATAFSKPRNDSSFFVIARVRRTRGNPQSTKPPQKTEKKKNSLYIKIN